MSRIRIYWSAMTEVPSLKERQVLRLGAQNPVETMTCRCQHPGFGSILNKRTDRSPGPTDSRIADATAGPSLCAPKNFGAGGALPRRSEEHTSELQSLIRISYDVFCL